MVEGVKADIHRRTRRRIDDAHRTGRIAAIHIAQARFAFVGCEDLRAIRREGDHVRLHTHLDRALEGQAAISTTAEERHIPVCIIRFCLDRCGQRLPIRRNSDRRHIAVGETTDQIFHINLRRRQILHTVRRRQATQRHTIQCSLDPVNHIGTIVHIIVDNNLCAAAVWIHHTRIIAADLSQIQRRIAIFITRILFVCGHDWRVAFGICRQCWSDRRSLRHHRTGKHKGCQMFAAFSHVFSPLIIQ